MSLLIFTSYIFLLKCLSYKFDTIFFDDAPNHKYPDPANIRLYYFYYALLVNHVNTNARFSWYCDIPLYWIVHPNTDFNLDTFKINIPDNAGYISKIIKEKQLMYMPKVIFKHGTIKDVMPICLDKNFNIDILNSLTNNHFSSSI